MLDHNKAQLPSKPWVDYWWELEKGTVTIWAAETMKGAATLTPNRNVSKGFIMAPIVKCRLKQKSHRPEPVLHLQQNLQNMVCCGWKSLTAENESSYLAELFMHKKNAGSSSYSQVPWFQTNQIFIKANRPAQTKKNKTIEENKQP